MCFDAAPDLNAEITLPIQFLGMVSTDLMAWSA